MNSWLRGYESPLVAKASGGGGGGDVSGPGSSTSGNLASWSGTGGDTLADAAISAISVSAIVGGQMTAAGSTGNNWIKFPDNLAEAFWLGQGTNRYLRFVSTDAGEFVHVDKPLAANADFYSGGRTTIYGWLIRDGSGYADSVTAHAGGGQGSATTLAYGVTFITVCATAQDSVVLRSDAGAASAETWVYNLGATTAALYPPSGGAINGGSTNASIDLPSGYLAICRNRGASGTWHVVVTPVQPVSGSAAVAAAGTNQGTATPLTSRVSYVTSGNGNGVRLPPGRPAGEVWTVYNASAVNPGASIANGISVYPSSGETILPLTANTRDFMSGNNASDYLSLGSGNWRSQPRDGKSDHITRTIGDTCYFYGVVNCVYGANISGGVFDSSSVLTQSANATFTKNIGYTIPSTLTTAGTTITVNWSSGVFQVIDLQGATGDVTLTLSNPLGGANYRLKVIQGSTARNLIWPAAVKWPAGLAPTISVTNDAIDMIYLDWDGTNYLASFRQAFA